MDHSIIPIIQRVASQSCALTSNVDTSRATNGPVSQLIIADGIPPGISKVSRLETGRARDTLSVDADMNAREQGLEKMRRDGSHRHRWFAGAFEP